MTKPGGSLTTKKPPYTNVDWKTLDDPEKFRDADRIEEAQKIPLTESQKKQGELEPIEKGACIIGEARKDREEPDWYPDGFTFQEKYEKEHKLRLEAEGETHLVKAVGMNSPEMKEAKKEIEALKKELAQSKEDHQYDNLVHQKELAKMGK